MSKAYQSTFTGELNTPYSKQFVHSKSSQYRRLKTEWKNNVYLARSRIQGLGLYAAKDLEKHTMVIEYIGTVIRNEVANRREKIYESQVTESRTNKDGPEGHVCRMMRRSFVETEPGDLHVSHQQRAGDRRDADWRSGPVSDESSLVDQTLRRRLWGLHQLVLSDFSPATSTIPVPPTAWQRLSRLTKRTRLSSSRVAGSPREKRWGTSTRHCPSGGRLQ